MSNSPTVVERLIAGFCYLSAGMIGIIWLLISAFRKNMPGKFLMFHIMQSVFLSLCYVALNFLFKVVVTVFEFIPFINGIVRQLVFWFNMPFFFGYSVMQCLIYGIIIYLAVFAFMGLYSYLPWVSKKINSIYK